MKYSVQFTKKALKQLHKMNKQMAAKILDYMEEIEQLDNPFSRGHGLVNNFKGMWRYRVEDWRILCEVKESIFLIHVMYIGHRDSIYKK